MKIFGIGLSKTGTTSLASALEMLGYRTKDYPGLTTYAPGDLSSVDPDILERHEALTDTPIPSFYRELDQRFPGAKFILTVRDMDGWLLSCKKQFTAKLAEKQNEAHNRLFTDLYGTAVFDEPLFRRGYQRFVEGVKDYFRDRPQDLLILDVAGGEGWEKLCPFLGKPIPDMPFPKANVTRILWMDLQELVSIAREAGQEVLRAHRSLVREGGERGAPASISSLMRKTVYSLGGGRPFALESATAAASKVIGRRLERLNPEIPIVSRQSHGTPAADRKHWSHFWLVDPLDGEAAFGGAAGDFTVNLALIENGKPIAGVVHAPLSDTTYYAMVGKGAFRAEGSGTARRLEGSAGALSPAASKHSSEVASVALALCRQVEAGGSPSSAPIESMEWQSAAPHALARLIGRHRLVDDGGAEPTYNKTDWKNPRIRVA